MRVSEATRRETRRRILEAARERFRAGYAEATTRAIATQAGIAAGTLFNYFPSKEALGFALVEEATRDAEAELEARGSNGSSLEETLFAQVALQLRHMEPLRTWVGEVFETSLSPLRAPADDAPGEFKRRHLERVQGWLDDAFGPRAERGSDLHLYWSLYLGVVSFWVRDGSENRAATLALLDRSMRLYGRTLAEESGAASAVPSNER